MSEFTLEPSLSKLPPEILRIIIPDKSRILSIDELCNWHDRHVRGWYPLESPLTPPNVDRRTEHTADSWMLRSLAQTCRSLRAITLPVLWSVCDVSTVAQLGCIREALRASPYLAQHVRSFSFLWQAPDTSVYEEYPQLDGKSLVELAFDVDRWLLWDELRKQHDCQILPGCYENAYGRHFRLGDAWHFEPGWVPAPRPKISDPNAQKVYNDPPHTNAGPDGRGDDRFIKSTEQFNEALVEVIAQFTSLEAFGWESAGTPLPRGAFDALLKLDTLQTLHLNMVPHRYSVHMVPFWELASSLVGLSIKFSSWALSAPRYSHKGETKSEQYEAALTKDLPAEPPAYGDHEASYSHNYSIVVRTVIAAARGGRLRKLRIANDEGGINHAMISPFAVRDLLPYWVAIQDWVHTGGDEYVTVAEALRRVLAHASLWLDKASTWKPRATRLLTRQDVQTLQHASRWEPDSPYATIALYLPWLCEDEELAGQVADAWNAVVQRGQADTVGRNCMCRRCRHLRLAARDGVERSWDPDWSEDEEERGSSQGSAASSDTDSSL